MKLKYCLTNGYIHFRTTMYMFAQNSIKKNRTCNPDITNAILSIFSFALLSPPLLLRFKSVASPFHSREQNGSHMEVTWDLHGRKNGFPEELIALEVYALPSIFAIFILSF